MTPGTTDVVVQEDHAIIVIRGVPAQVCSDCDEYLLSEAIALEVSRLVDHAMQGGTEVSILRYAA